MKAGVPSQIWLWATICFLVALTSSPSIAQQGQRDADEDLMTYFYKDPRPERLVGFIGRYQSKPAGEKWEAYPALTGFLAALCKVRSSRFEQLIPTDLKPRAAVAIDAAVRLCGNESIATKLRPRLERSATDAQLKAALTGLPPRLDDLRVTTPTHLDVLWGASFASGDARYVKIIIEFFAQTANRSEATALDIAQAVIAMTRGPKESLGQLRAKYGDAGFREIVYAASALWALQSNARQHAFVDQFVAKYVADHAGTPAAKALAVFRGSGTKT